MSIPPRSRGELEATGRTSPATARLELPVAEFIHTQGASGILLLIAATAAMVWANSPYRASYFHLWEMPLSIDFGLLHISKSLHHWINDGLMAVFFFLVGMEIKHEMLSGQLSSFRRAALPVVAALGGMVVPAAVYLAFNHDGMRSGWGVPMATDIAFALAVLAMVPRVPIGLKVFLLALAIVDDLGAIAVIAFFYTETVNFGALGIAAVLVGVIFAFRKAGVRLAFPYVLTGLFVWVCVLKSGVHATIAGVVLAFAISSKSPLSKESFSQSVQPLLEDFTQGMRERSDDRADVALGAIETLASATESPLERATRQLHSWVSFLILPLFAFANAGVAITFDKAILTNAVALGIAAGLLIGKPLGIVSFSWVAVKSRLAELPESIRWPHMWATGIIAGIGFTVAIFIADLAFEQAEYLKIAKLAILATSIVAGIAGWSLLRLVPVERRKSGDRRSKQPSEAALEPR